MGPCVGGSAHCAQVVLLHVSADARALVENENDGKRQ